MTISEFKTILDSIDPTAFGKFVINYHNDKTSENYSMNQYFKDIRIEDLVNSAFPWYNSPERANYWENLDELYTKKIMENNND